MHSNARLSHDSKCRLGNQWREENYRNNGEVLSPLLSQCGTCNFANGIIWFIRMSSLPDSNDCRSQLELGWYLPCYCWFSDCHFPPRMHMFYRGCLFVFQNCTSSSSNICRLGHARKQQRSVFVHFLKFNVSPLAISNKYSFWFQALRAELTEHQVRIFYYIIACELPVTLSVVNLELIDYDFNDFGSLEWLASRN